MVQMVWQENRVDVVKMVHRDHADHEEKQVDLVWLDRRVIKVYLVRKDLLDQKDIE